MNNNYDDLPLKVQHLIHEYLELELPLSYNLLATISQVAYRLGLEENLNNTQTEDDKCNS